MITNADLRHMEFVLENAKGLDRVSGARISAGLKVGSALILGKNSYKTHPLQAQFGRNSKCIHLHAEIDAIVRAINIFSIEQVRGSTIYIARAKCLNSAPSMRKTMVMGNAKPCKGCMRAILQFSIDKVIYTTDKQEVKELF